MRTRVVITCEHAGNRIPVRYRRFFRGSGALIQSHRGWDGGALAMARTLSRGLRAPLFASSVSRLVVDLNRSPGHRQLFSPMMRHAARGIREEALERYYRPFRRRVEQRIASWIARGACVLHISSHSFDPVLKGKRRNADIGLLYDPARRSEASFCLRWQEALAKSAPALKVRRNYPYSGKSDGFTKAMRLRFPARAYAGVELEVNQRHFVGGGRHWRALCAAVREAAQSTLAGSARSTSRTSRGLIGGAGA